METGAGPLTPVAPGRRVWAVGKRGTENALDCWRHLDNCIASPWAGWFQHAGEGAISMIGHEWTVIRLYMMVWRIEHWRW